MIAIRFGRWNYMALKKFAYNRILINGYIWTPFVRVKIIKRNDDLYRRINNIKDDNSKFIY